MEQDARADPDGGWARAVILHDMISIAFAPSQLESVTTGSASSALRLANGRCVCLRACFGFGGAQGPVASRLAVGRGLGPAARAPRVFLSRRVCA